MINAKYFVRWPKRARHKQNRKHKLKKPNANKKAKRKEKSTKQTKKHNTNKKAKRKQKKTDWDKVNMKTR